MSKNPSQNRLGEGDSPQFCSADSAKMGTVPGSFVRGSNDECLKNDEARMTKCRTANCPIRHSSFVIRHLHGLAFAVPNLRTHAAILATQLAPTLTSLLNSHAALPSRVRGPMSLPVLQSPPPPFGRRRRHDTTAAAPGKGGSRCANRKRGGVAMRKTEELAYSESGNSGSSHCRDSSIAWRSRINSALGS